MKLLQTILTASAAVLLSSTALAVKPDVLTQTKTAVDRQNAQVTHAVRTNGLDTTVTFEYGLTQSYGSTLPEQNLTGVEAPTTTPLEWNITGLQPNVSYFYRITAVNADGTTTATGSFTASPNAEPFAEVDTIFVPTTTKGLPIVVADTVLLENDFDGNVGDDLTIISVTGALGGQAAVRGSNVYFTPDITYTGFGLFSYTVADQFGATSSTTVLVRSFAAATGYYVATVDSGSGQDGFANLTVGKAGGFTGSVLLEGRKYSFRGTLGNDGTASVNIPRRAPLTPLSLSVNFSLLGDLATFEGNLSDGTNDYLVTGVRAAQPTEIVNHVGQFNLRLAADDSGPTGSGFAVARVIKSGAVRFTGKLSDGVPFSASTVVNASLETPVYAALYGKPYGSVAGLLSFADAQTLGGSLGWTKPVQTPVGLLYPLGFTTAVEVTGQRYVAPPRGHLPAGWAVSPAPFTFTLSGGGLAAPVTKSATVNNAGVISIVGANPENVTLRLVLSSGQISGSFKPLGATKPAAIFGTLFEVGEGAGAFVTPTASGSLTLSAQ